LTNGHSALTSDDLKDPPVTEGEHDDWYHVVPTEAENAKSLQKNIGKFSCGSIPKLHFGTKLAISPLTACNHDL